MTLHRSVGLVVTALLLSHSANSGELPIQRSPAGPPAMELLPPNSTLRERDNTRSRANLGTSPSATIILQDRVQFQNIGNQPLFLYYWDGSDWQSVSVESGQITDVICARCGTTINIAFHNGKEKRTLQAQTGGTYYLFWSPQAGVWDLKPRT
jgi:hypothetical protein